jgi:RimJ/RimL family protein N-acetyltransferase
MIKIFKPQNPIATFKTKSGKMIKVCEPSMERLPALLKLVNDLTREDTFLTFHGRPITLNEERKWLEGTIRSIKNKKAYAIWAFYGDEMVGECSLNYGLSRMPHVGKLGLMVAKDFRNDGIGSFLMDYILKKAKKLKLKIVRLSVFSDNIIAIDLYQKLGFKEWGRLPQGFYRKNKFSDRIDMYKKI